MLRCAKVPQICPRGRRAPLSPNGNGSPGQTRAASGQQHHHRFRRRLVSPDVRTAAKVIGLLLGVATLATLTGLIIAGTTIGLALLLIR